MNTPAPTAPFSDAMFALTLGLLLLAPLVIAWIALLNTGLGRSRSAAQAMLGCLTLVGVAAIAFAVAGASFAGAPGHVLRIAGKTWDWIGGAPLLLWHFNTLGREPQLEILFQFMAAGLLAIIPWGSGADRLRLPAGAGVSEAIAPPRRPGRSFCVRPGPHRLRDPQACGRCARRVRRVGCGLEGRGGSQTQLEASANA